MDPFEVDVLYTEDRRVSVEDIWTGPDGKFKCTLAPKWPEAPVEFDGQIPAGRTVYGTIIDEIERRYSRGS